MHIEHSSRLLFVLDIHQRRLQKIRQSIRFILHDLYQKSDYPKKTHVVEKSQKNKIKKTPFWGKIVVVFARP